MLEDGTARLMLDEAGAHPDEIVRPAPVHAMPCLLPLPGAYGGHDLVAIGHGLVHANDVIHITARSVRTAPRALRACGRAGWDRERTATRNRHTGRHGGMIAVLYPTTAASLVAKLEVP